jgi:DMSO reductase family type II enzyme molybdopterin subunit
MAGKARAPLPSLSSLTNLGLDEASQGDDPETSTGAAMVDYRAVADIYRQRWRWDKVVKGTHILNCWYQRNCCFNLYVKDGLVLREEQSGEYPRTNLSVPDFNPRGCQNGACYSLQMYHPARIKYPLKRAGERGEGKWERVSWDEALTDIADKVVDTLARDGPASVIFDPGGSVASLVFDVATLRFANLLDAIVLDTNCELGDEQQGAAVTLGVPVACKSGDDYFYSDLILIWGGNPAYTQVPNCHFSNEARYRGARVVAISPDYNASAIHADWWIPVQPGSDAALALAMAQVIISERLYDASFVREQTDLPFLMREDTRTFLRESDIRARGRDDAFYLYDQGRKKIVQASKKTLRLGGTLPALEGEYEVDTKGGKVKAKPVFQLLKDRLEADYTPEKASHLCGVHPDTIRRLAFAIAKAKAASCVAGASLSKYYHGDLMMRAQILVFALCGQMGKKGAGYDTLPYLALDGGLRFPFAERLGWLDTLKMMVPLLPSFLRMIMNGYTNEMIYYEVARRHPWYDVNSVLFWYLQGGLKEISGRSREWDPYLPRDVDEYIEEARRRGWQALPPENEPKVLFVVPGNSLRRVRGAHRLKEQLFPKLDLIVAVDLRMSSTALYSDYILPAASSYEKADVSEWNTPLSPFAHATNAAVPPLGEAKPEWEILVLLAKKIQQRARERGVLSFVGRDGKRKHLDDICDRMTFQGRFTEKEQEKLTGTLVESSTNLGRVSWAELEGKGFARFTTLGRHPANIGNATDVKPGETITPHTWRTEKKIPWPTLTRRIQFYIDHPLYLELGEELPVHKDPPKSGGDYPLVMTGGHSRYSIHASLKDNPLLLELERGEPVMFMSVEDAEERGIRDGDRVKVYNDVGHFLVPTKVSPAVRPGQVIIYHAWENFQFAGGMGHRNVMASPINPVELAGGYFHLRPAPAILQPGQSDRETRVEVLKV